MKKRSRGRQVSRSNRWNIVGNSSSTVIVCNSSFIPVGILQDTALHKAGDIAVSRNSVLIYVANIDSTTGYIAVH